MWGFWGSDARMRLALRGSAVLLTALFVALPAAIAQSRDRRGDSDTAHVVRRILVDQTGIRVERSEPAAGRSVHGSTVQIDAGGIRIGDPHDSLEEIEAQDGILVVDTDGDDVVRVFSDASIEANERIEGDVVAVFGSVRVDGEVGGNVVAVFGSIRLGGEAKVDGDAVAVGGVLDQAQGARVNGESVSLGFLPFAWGIPTLRSVLLAIAGCWIVSLVAGWLLVLVFPTRMLRVASTASNRGGASFLVGVLSAPLVLVAIFLLCVTVIGVPIAFLLPLLYVLSAWAGHIAATWVLGSRIARRGVSEGNPMAAILAGSLFVAVFFAVGAILAGPEGASRTFALFFYLLGALLIVGLTAIGTGAVFLSRFGTRSGNKLAESGSPTVHPHSAPSPPPSAAPAAPPGI